MFLTALTEPQKRAFLALARDFVQVDQELSEQESSLLTALFAETRLPASAIDGEADLSVFDSRRSQVAVILELIGIGHADSEYGPEEAAFVQGVAERLGVGETELLEMENWVLRQTALAREAEKFWTE